VKHLAKGFGRIERSGIAVQSQALKAQCLQIPHVPTMSTGQIQHMA